MPGPNYRQLIRVFHAARRHREHEHAFSRSPHEMARKDVVAAGKALDDALREAGVQLHRAEQEQPVLFPPPPGGRR